MKALADRKPWPERSAAGLHASRDSLYLILRAARQHRAGVKPFPLALLPRRCPACGQETIIGHGKRRRQAHDQIHDWIWVRRGQCRPCGRTYTIVPTWSPPYGHYSLACRQQACQDYERLGSSEQVAPLVKDAQRVPDGSTVRRWLRRRLASCWACIRCEILLGFPLPTILAWDWISVGRNLRWEANSP